MGEQTCPTRSKFLFLGEPFPSFSWALGWILKTNYAGVEVKKKRVFSFRFSVEFNCFIKVQSEVSEV